MTSVDDGDTDDNAVQSNELFAVRLSELFRAAGDPTLERVTRQTRERLGPTWKVPTIQRVQSWRAGKHVPAKFASLEPILVTLRYLARQRKSAEPVAALTMGAWQKLWQEARDKPAVTASVSRPVTDTLPRDIPLIGRGEELERIVSIAERGGVLSISGMPGVGKTAFVTSVAHRLEDRFPDGRLFVDLQAHAPGRTAASPADVLAGLLTDLGMDSREIPDTLESRRSRWRDRVAGRRILLVLDDAGDRAQVEPLLPTGPDCLTLITSRRQLVALDDHEPLVLDALQPDLAAELFCTRARLDRADREHPAVAEIVRLCGCLPLAIVLIAGRMRYHSAWTVTTVARDLATAQDRLGEFEADERAVRAAFTMSYDVMPPDRQHLFRRLGIHPGRTVDKFAAAALDGIEVADARRELEALFTDHLLREQLEGRYRMHDLLRVYASELAEHDPAFDRRAAVDRVLTYYWHAGEIADRCLAVETRSRRPPINGAFPATPRPASRAQALAWLRAERDNLLDSLEYAAADRERRWETIGLTGVVAGLLRLDGPWPVAIELHRRAAALANFDGDRRGEADAQYNLSVMRYATGDYPGAVGPMLEASAIYQEIGHPADHARALGMLGTLAYATGDYPRTAELMQRAAAIYERDGDGSAGAYALIGQGMAGYATGDYPVAAQWVSRALQTFRDIGDSVGEAAALDRLGVIQYATGDYSLSAASVEQALAIYRAAGDRFAEAHALNALASVRFATAEYAVAADHAWEALQIFRTVGDRVGEAYALDSLARLHFTTAEWQSAGDDMNRALAIFRDIGDRVGEAYAVNDLSLSQYISGDYSGTVERMEAAMLIFRDIGDRVGQAYTLIGLGLVAYANGDYTAAKDPMLEARALFEQIGDKVGLAYVLVGLGRLRIATGEDSGAADLLAQASTLFGDIDDKVGQAYVLISQGRLRFAIGDGNGAIELLLRAERIYRDIGDRFGQAFALGGVALLHYAQGNSSGAIDPAERALGIFDAIGDRVCHAYTFVGLGLLRYADGDHSGAVAMVERAPAMFHEVGDRVGEAYAFIGLGLLQYQTGNYSEMANWAQRGLAIFREIDKHPRRAELLERITNTWEEASNPHDAIISYLDGLRLIREIQIRWRKRRVWRDLPAPTSRR
ncbi:tetratricopeptide (TPR) repeat protein [Nocardia sp. GAS34]|uniref:tetratricopeptide repeat protein n=1 Tax=unclassified Nocardia TaxID=2637762 RepID=UPI003D1E9FAC